MGALVMSTPARTGGAVTVNTGTASDTITKEQLGSVGCVLVAVTAGTINTITVSDAGKSPAGNAAAPVGQATVATGVKAFYISPSQADSGGLVTVTAAPATALTYHLYPASAR